MDNQAPPEILVVDDDPDVRRMLQNMVESLGYRARPAATGLEALTLIQHGHPDAVLLDLSLPGIDGLEVCRRLRSDPNTSTLPILLITANGDQQTRLAGFQAGADD